VLSDQQSGNGRDYQPTPAQGRAGTIEPLTWTRRWGWSGLVSQAGLALGIAAAVSKEFPAF
jgi:hypothetical protein